MKREIEKTKVEDNSCMETVSRVQPFLAHP